MYPNSLILLFLLFFFSAASVFAEASGSESETADKSTASSSSGAPLEKDACEAIARYTFSWPLVDGCAMQPRGGTSVGAPVTVEAGPSPQWKALLDSELTSFERDRKAILAMAGAYRTSFEFLETVGYTPEFVPSRPYQSWATEYVYVVEDSKEFISLQHIMVMFFMNDDKVSGPVVMKHWRQDWQYQKRELLTYVGRGKWKKQAHSPSAVRGTWAQAVYQVDDSPRYESFGQWQHFPNFSTWQSAQTWRPLPRREHSVRNDYQVLEGYNRHTITPDGWVHEQENYKVKLNEKGDLAESMPYLAKELGLNRYTRITGFDFSAGDQYWRQTGPFWREVRRQWDALIEQHPAFELRKAVDGNPLHRPLFEYAQNFSKAEADRADREFIAQLLAEYVVTEIGAGPAGAARSK